MDNSRARSCYNTLFTCSSPVSTTLSTNLLLLCLYSFYHSFCILFLLYYATTVSSTRVPSALLFVLLSPCTSHPDSQNCKWSENELVDSVERSLLFCFCFCSALLLFSIPAEGAALYGLLGSEKWAGGSRERRVLLSVSNGDGVGSVALHMSHCSSRKQCKLHEWMTEWTGEWVSEWVSVWVNAILHLISMPAQLLLPLLLLLMMLLSLYSACIRIRIEFLFWLNQMHKMFSIQYEEHTKGGKGEIERRR